MSPSTKLSHFHISSLINVYQTTTSYITSTCLTGCYNRYIWLTAIHCWSNACCWVIWFPTASMFQNTAAAGPPWAPSSATVWPSLHHTLLHAIPRVLSVWISYWTKDCTHAIKLCTLSLGVPLNEAWSGNRFQISKLPIKIWSNLTVCQW